MDSDILAGRPPGAADLRSLDAIHLVSALSLGDDLRAIAVYDPGWRRRDRLRLEVMRRVVFF